MSSSIVNFCKIFVFFLVFVPGIGIAGEDINQDMARELKQQGVILPLEKILEAALKLHSGRVISVELEGKKNNLYIYEVEIADSHGQVWEMKFDASDAKLLSQERDD